MTGTSKNFTVLLGVMLPVAAASIVWLRMAGASDETLIVALRLTARIAFMIYLLVFVARPLRQLLPGRFTKWLLAERRSLGIAFAAVFSVHLGLIALRFSTIPGLEYPLSSALVGGTAYALCYLMLVTSFDGPARALGPGNWRRLHRTGLYFIGAIFLFTLLPEPGQPILTAGRLWFVVLTAGALIIRLTAFFAVRSGTRRPL